MRRDRILYAAALFTILVASAASLLAAEGRVPVDSSSSAGLVRAALESELGGRSEVRDELLRQALARDPNYAPARWQSGFVRWDGQWLTPSEVASRAARDPLLAEYRKRRDAMVDRADDHRELATWCQNNKLIDLERVHWVKVLEFESTDEQALSALDLQWHDGYLLTHPQIERATTAALDQRKANKYWQPRVVKWRTAIDRGTPSQRDKAIAEMTAISDHHILPAFQAVCSINGQDTSPGLRQLVIETVSRMPEFEATLFLVRYALFTDSPELRQICVAALKKRSPPTYVPLLLAVVPKQIESQHAWMYLVDGTVIREHQFLLKDAYGYRFFRLIDEDVPIQPEMRLSNRGIWIAYRAAVAQQEAAAFTSDLEQRRIELTRRLGVICSQLEFLKKSPEDDWQQAWERYCEGYSPPSASLVRYSISHQTRSTVSCFPAGTPIVTIAGLSPIERLRPGDLVLAQNPQTGELAYKSVQRVTLRPASPLVKIRTGGETLLATRGHPFWVNDKGWVMAKQMQVGHLLHTPGGSVTIDELAEAPAREAYNLVVSDFNSYFVGDRQLLVHDNSPLLESDVRVPGLVTENN
jgi:hypothetical protein